MSHTPAGSPTSPEHDARRPGHRNRLRRLLHPHRRTVLRLTVAAVIAIAILASVGGAIRSLRADGRPPIRPNDVDELQADWVTDLGAGAIIGLAVDGSGVFASTEAGLAKLDASCERPASTSATGSPSASEATPPASPGSTGSECETAWQGVVFGAPLSPPVVFDDRVFAGSSSGLVYAFPTECSVECEPEWVGDAGNSPVSQPAVNDDFVYVTSDRLYAFPSGCGTDDRICSPVWTADIPGRPSGDPPAIGGGLVIVSSSAAGGSVYAFPAVCSARCQPVWAASTSGAPGGSAIQGGTAYVAAAGRLLAFDLSCQGACSLTWSGSFLATSTVSPGAGGAPTPQGEHVFVGADDGTLTVFPASCAESSCEAARVFDVSDGALSRPWAHAGVIYVTSADGVLYGVIDDCDPSETTCDRPWSTELEATTEAAVVVGEGAVYAGDDSGRVYAFSLQAAP